MEEERYGRYLLIMCAVAALIVGHVFALNYLYDPWWHFDGNKVGIKAAFELKEARINQLDGSLRLGRKYDCVVLGSSRLLTFNPHSVPEHSCFNSSLNSATYPQMLAYARYFERQAGTPKLIVMGVDDWQLVRKLPAVSELKPLTKPAPWYETYFALDAFRFSKRIAKEHRLDPGYGQDWQPKLLPARTKREHPIERRFGTLDALVEKEGPLTYYPENFAWLAEFRKSFPKTRLVGFVTPITPDLLAKAVLKGGVDELSSALHRASSYFDVFHDFTFPNELNLNAKNSWDGSHFKPPYSEYVSRSLFGEEEGLALDVKSLSLTSYQKLYRVRVQELLEEYRPAADAL